MRETESNAVTGRALEEQQKLEQNDSKGNTETGDSKEEEINVL